MRTEIARACLALTATAALSVLSAGPSQAAESCLSSSSSRMTLSGAGQTDFQVNAATGIDAGRVEWRGTDAFLLSLRGGPKVCWSGGRVFGSWNQETTSWDVYHSTSGLGVYTDDTIIEDFSVHNYGDATRQRSPTNRWELRRSYFWDIHDDAVEDEDHASVKVLDNLFDGVNVAISTRNSDSSVDGSGNLIEMRGNLIRFKKFALTYKGNPGHGGVFKYDKDGRGPQIAMHDNVIVAGPIKGSDGHSLFPYLTKLAACSNNKLVWVGTPADFDAALAQGSGPDGLDDRGRLGRLGYCFQVVKVAPRSGQSFEQARAEVLAQHWDPLVAAWKSSHVAAGGQPGPTQPPTAPAAPILLE